MINFPSTTRVFKNIPKEAFYKNLAISRALKEKFISQIEKIIVEYSFKKDNLNFINDSQTQEIIVLGIILKKKELDNKILETIARQNPHNLVFLIEYENRQKLAIYHQKIYQTLWEDKDKISLKINGFSLDEVWDNFLREIALENSDIKENTEEPVENLLSIQDETKKLETLIDKTTTKMTKEVQSKKKFALHKKLKEYKEMLRKLLKGKSLW